MATTKNITMKQFNGTDYDTLYPKTVAAQIDDVYSKNETYPKSQLYTQSQLYTRQQILSDATKTLYGLNSSAIPDDVFSWIISWIDQEAPRIETGSYVGTGTGGENNPNSLTFAFVPKVVMICGDDTQLLYGTSYGSHPVFGVLWDQLSSEYKSIASNRYRSMQVKATDKTLSWYTAMGVSESIEKVAEGQLNTSGSVYRYVAFG